MIRLKRPHRVLAIWLLVSGFHCLGQDFSKANSTFALKGNAVQSSKAPLLFTITIKNTSKQPIQFWNPHDGRVYPNARYFSAKITPQPGAVRPVILNNWQYEEGSGDTAEVKPGESLDVPAACEPLPPGTYRFSVENSPPLQIVVVQDDKLQAAYEETVLAALPREEPFFQQLAAHYRNEKIDGILLQDILSNDLDLANASVQALFPFDDNQPKGIDKICSRALFMNLVVNDDASKSWTRQSLLSNLGLILVKCRTDLALDSLVGFAHSGAIDQYAESAGRGNEVRRGAVDDIGQFTQPRVLGELLGFLADKDYLVQEAAAEALARRKDPLALEFFLKLAGTPQAPGRGEAIGQLGYYPNNPEVQSVLEKAERDHDRNIRFQARDALTRIEQKN